MGRDECEKKVTPQCVRCDGLLEDAVPEPKGFQPYRGLAFRTYGHYGSTAFDPMDGTWIEIVLCDKCLNGVAKIEGGPSENYHVGLGVSVEDGWGDI